MSQTKKSPRESFILRKDEPLIRRVEEPTTPRLAKKWKSRMGREDRRVGKICNIGRIKKEVMVNRVRWVGSIGRVGRLGRVGRIDNIGRVGRAVRLRMLRRVGNKPREGRV